MDQKHNYWPYYPWIERVGESIRADRGTFSSSKFKVLILSKSLHYKNATLSQGKKKGNQWLAIGSIKSQVQVIFSTYNLQGTQAAVLDSTHWSEFVTKPQFSKKYWTITSCICSIVCQYKCCRVFLLYFFLVPQQLLMIISMHMILLAWIKPTCITPFLVSDYILTLRTDLRWNKLVLQRHVYVFYPEKVIL